MTAELKSVYTITRTMTDSNGTILIQHTCLFKDLETAKAQFRDIIEALETDYDCERDRLELSPRAASLYYENGGTDYTTLEQITIL